MSQRNDAGYRKVSSIEHLTAGGNVVVRPEASDTFHPSLVVERFLFVIFIWLVVKDIFGFVLFNSRAKKNNYFLSMYTTINLSLSLSLYRHCTYMYMCIK